MPPAVSSRLVLVVEDDPTLRSLYRSLLCSAGYPVIDVDDGLAALRVLETTRPAAVVLDLALPRLDGRDVHQEMKSREEMEDIPVIVVSGTDTSDLNESDFSCILRKPINPDSLLSALQACIRRTGRR